jgi:hypothetical protein
VTLAWQNIMSKPARKPKAASPVRAAQRKAARPVRPKKARLARPPARILKKK